MEGDRNKQIKWGGCNLSKIEKLEICIARRFMNHIDCCSIEDLIRLAKIVIPDCSEIKILEEELKKPS